MSVGVNPSGHEQPPLFPDGVPEGVGSGVASLGDGVGALTHDFSDVKGLTSHVWLRPQHSPSQTEDVVAGLQHCPAFVIGLIEHKSLVSQQVSAQGLFNRSPAPPQQNGVWDSKTPELLQCEVYPSVFMQQNEELPCSEASQLEESCGSDTQHRSFGDRHQPPPPVGSGLGHGPSPQ